MNTQLIIIFSVLLGVLIPLFIFMNIDKITGFFKNLLMNKIFVDPILAEKRLQILKQQYAEIKKYFYEKSTKNNNDNISRCQKINSICPKCNSTNVNHRIKRIQGKVDVYGSSFPLFGNLSNSLYGEIDTNEINKCNDCQNEWKVDDYKYSGPHEFMKYSIKIIYYYFYWIKKCRKVDFDKNNLSEIFSSYEEKKKYEMNEAINDSWSIREIKEIWGKYSIELFEYIFKEEHDRLHNDFYGFYKPKLLENIGIKHIDDFIN